MEITLQSIIFNLAGATLLTVLLIAFFFFAIVTALIAHHNERDKVLAFMAGLLLGPLAVAMYAIMGETIELRVALEEKERRRLRLERKEEQSQAKLAQNLQDS